MRQILCLSVLITALATGMARTEDGPHENTWGLPAAPRPVTLAVPYSDCRLTACETPCPGNAPACAAQTAGPMIIDMTPYSPPRGYSPSADFGARVQAAPGCAIAGDAPLPMANFPHPVSMPPQPFAVYTPICPSSCPAEAPSAGYLPQPPASFASPEAAVSQPIFTAALPPPVPHPMAYAPGGPAVYPHPTSLPPSTAFVQYGPYACVPSACACPSCYGPACECPNAAATSYHPQVIYPASQCCNQAGAESCGDCADRLDHILEAVRHLEAAGLQVDADRLRHQCDAEMRDIVERLKRAEAELAQFRQSANGKSNSQSASLTSASSEKKMVAVSFQLMELNRTKCEEYGIELSGEATDLIDRLDSLKKKGVLEVISRPKVMAVSGETAVLYIGQRVPVLDGNASDPGTIDERQVGTKIEVRSDIKESGKVRLKFHCNVNTYNIGDALQPDGIMTPVIEGRDIQTTLEVPSGKAALLTAMLKTRNEPQVVEHVQRTLLSNGDHEEQIVREETVVPTEVQLLVLMRPDIVGADPCNSTSSADVKCAEVVDWIKSAMTESKSNCVSPACCDEGPACKCAGSCCAAQTQCAESGSMSEAKSIFALPALQQPFAPQTIYVDPTAFTPIDIQQRSVFDRNFEYDFQMPTSSGQFLPANVAPVRFAQPVVLPVEASTLK
jgi:hypothetical protein